MLPLAIGIVLLSLACSSNSPRWNVQVKTDHELVSALNQLGHDALRRKQYAAAEARFLRALLDDPNSVAARLGLARIAIAQSQWEYARAQWSQAKEVCSSCAEVWIVAARLALGEGSPGVSREHLEQALAHDPYAAEAHDLLAKLTSHAAVSSQLGPTLQLRVRPYDLHVRRVAAEQLIDAGRFEEALSAIEESLWLADQDEGEVLQLLKLEQNLRKKPRSIVWVNSYADEELRAMPGWKYQIRVFWREANRVLSPILGLRFLPRRIEDFSIPSNVGELQSIEMAFLRRLGETPPAGVLVAFSGREPSQRRGHFRRGQADFLGRRVVVRVEESLQTSRILAHEMLHLFGAVHVVSDLDSLMNPSGSSKKLDALNAEIVRSLRLRSFESDELESEVFSKVNLSETTDAYLALLKVNLAYRNIANQSVRDPGVRVAGLDPHLADVSRFVGRLLERQGKIQEAQKWMGNAARLYGFASLKGKGALAEMERLQALPAVSGY